MESYNWMPEVLQDLQTFAANNEFSKLAEMLEDAKFVAIASIARREHRGRTLGIRPNDVELQKLDKTPDDVRLNRSNKHLMI